MAALPHRPRRCSHGDMTLQRCSLPCHNVIGGEWQQRQWRGATTASAKGGAARIWRGAAREAAWQPRGGGLIPHIDVFRVWLQWARNLSLAGVDLVGVKGARPLPATMASLTGQHLVAEASTVSLQEHRQRKQQFPSPDRLGHHQGAYLHMWP
uniref:Cl2727_2b n=1 Tax=Arundo donax TaxID=35708 RepID=A0A0A9RWD0_ARUDO